MIIIIIITIFMIIVITTTIISSSYHHYYYCYYYYYRVLQIGTTASPTKSPTTGPTASTTKSPTTSLTASPTKSPTTSPTASPTSSPSSSPTAYPFISLVTNQEFSLTVYTSTLSNPYNNANKFVTNLNYNQDPLLNVVISNSIALAHGITIYSSTSKGFEKITDCDT